ncbi:hypothetical protein ACQUY5_26910 [Bacillus cereus]|uniref:hypothetical protein n=1 Tax=Bacillus cereus TaxID=1396 RepID=UPI003D1682A2
MEYVFLCMYMFFQTSGMMIFSLYIINKDLLNSFYKHTNSSESVERYSFELSILSFIVVFILCLVNMKLVFLPYNLIIWLGTVLSVSIVLFFKSELRVRKGTTRFSKHKEKIYKLSSVLCLVGYVATIFFYAK